MLESIFLLYIVWVEICLSIAYVDDMFVKFRQ